MQSLFSHETEELQLYEYHSAVNLPLPLMPVIITPGSDTKTEYSYDDYEHIYEYVRDSRMNWLHSYT